MGVHVTETSLVLPTYPFKAPQELPMFAEFRAHQNAGGNPYPAKIVSELDHSKKEDRVWRIIRLENDYLRIELMPELGGRIYSAYDKLTGYDFFYKQHVIKPALIGMLGMWVSGGVEFNWPYHHRPSTFTPVDVKIEYAKDGTATVWMSEHEPLHHMKGMVGIRLRPDAAIFDTLVKVYNRTEVRHGFLWWENAAVPVNPQYRLFFPPDVRYVQFHYRKDVQSYPIAHGNYNGFRLGDNCDIRLHKNTVEPTSYFCAESNYDFFGGYDEGKQCGVVNISDHNVSVGKKMFTWGYTQLAKSWENALTDADGSYAELMAGSYSNNQPDFTWLEPYEEKEFCQSWFPIGNMGVPVCATYHFAISHNGDKCRLHATGTFKQVCVVLNNKTYFLDRMAPDQDREFELDDSLKLAEVYAEGKLLLRFCPEEDCPQPTPQPLEDIPSIDRMRSAQECYLTGVHLKQYHDAVASPAAYWEKALQFESDHAPSLLALAQDAYENLFYTTALAYAQRAWQSVTRYNFRPEEGKYAYTLGLIYEALDRPSEAMYFYQRAAWNQDMRSAAMTRVAMLDGKKKDYAAMRQHANCAVMAHSSNRTAQALGILAAYRQGDREASAEALERLMQEDPVNLLAIFLNERLFDRKYDYLALTDTDQNRLDLVDDLEDCGEYDWAHSILNDLERNKNAFPSRRCEERFLRARYETAKSTPREAYDYACFLYARKHWKEAAEIWQAIDTPHAKRNLAAALYSHLNNRDKALALLEDAYRAAPDDAQIAFELLFILGRMNAPIERRLQLADELRRFDREDILVERARTLNYAGRHAEALELMLSRPLTPCEGGEHAVAEQYMSANFGLGCVALAEKKPELAMNYFRDAAILPDNLGSGLWHEALRVPAYYMQGVALYQMHRQEESEACFQKVLDIPLDYFSQKQFPELPCYQAKILQSRGETEAANVLLQAHESAIQAMRRTKDSGYFQATPHFIVYCDTARLLRKAAADWQSSMLAWARSEKNLAIERACDALVNDPFILYAPYMAKGMM